MVHPGRKVCLATLSLRIQEPSREMFTSNHVRILLEKQVIFSLGYYENNFFFKKRINRLSFHLWIVNVIQLRKLKKNLLFSVDIDLFFYTSVVIEHQV